ncbi:hypothetical protein LEN26_008506 [Aphanomyces euteiches]|nr:hypothetical protein AeMF1_011861 [Aphanomyces euteiches]KAH9130444.1 hypothetical protein LEN26_008506 [Aphanomyces euteiches]KAH9133615.1 hypothetical protein AeRB84_020330 [Aphanomyces euteiches]KAH9137638.1 hypothetical protein AeRB84_017742 [Aphanomyces euteiches]KAH9147345.1 hypothetical protein AeRB84_009013 [Aphanomyces euteiches]
MNGPVEGQRKEDDGDAEYEELIPPENFAMVERGLYRSGFPKKKNFTFLRTLGLKSILTLVLEDYPLANTEFNKMHNITLLQFGVPGNKEPFVDIPEKGIAAALSAIKEIIRCSSTATKEKQVTRLGSLRKVQRWAFSSIFDEYIRFSHPKPRMMDQQFIELFKTELVKENAENRPAWPGL